MVWAKEKKALRDEAFSLPDAWEDHPWGESVAKVGKKVFVFFGRSRKDGFGFSVKLRHSSEGALLLPFTEPTGYGLGKSGWVTASFTKGDKLPPLGMLLAWIEESYRAVAGKTQLKRLDATSTKGAAAPHKSKPGSARRSQKKTGTNRRGQKKTGTKKTG